MMKYPKVWAPSGGPHVGQEFPIQNAGPLITPFDPKFLGPASYDIQVGLNFASPSALQAYVLRGSERLCPANGDWTAVPGRHGYALGNWRILGVADMARAIRTGRPHRASGALALR